MSNNPRPAGVPWLMPHITVKDVAKALEFYQKAFGFEQREVIHDEAGVIMHAELSWQSEILMLGAEEKYDNTAQSPATSGVQSPINLYIYVHQVDEHYQRALAAGAESLMAPQDMFWGDRMCKVKDPDGIYWTFATHLS